MKYILLLTLLLLSGVTYSCSCISFGKIDEKQYNEYDIIIKGNISEIEEKKFTRIIHIKVDTYYKGKSTRTTVKVESPGLPGMCGIFPKTGEQWLVFAYKNGNSYTTNLCTRTKNLNPNAWDYRKEEIKEDLKFLEDISGTTGGIQQKNNKLWRLFSFTNQA